MTGEKKASAVRYHRRTLMSAADRLLVEFGYDGMNMNMLAKEAGYSKATVYVYFESKDEIVGALAAERLDLLQKELALVIKSDLTADEKYKEIGRVLTEFATEDKVYFDFVTSKVDASKEEEASATFSELITRVNDILEELLPLADKETLLAKWYAFYGRIKTSKLFG
ncbi:MAG: TetR/AcrR family transcriptional regulator [Clostridiales bacterium]|nr:TetR/AcrR family transcriptional regulator [Clostridiales bacterium]